MTITPGLPLRLALVTVPCPACGGTGELPMALCQTCRRPGGTPGRVPWLKGVRVECGHYPLDPSRITVTEANEFAAWHDKSCRGWEVSEDTEVWLEAAKPEMLKRNCYLVPTKHEWQVWPLVNELIAKAPTVKEAVQLALEKVVP